MTSYPNEAEARLALIRVEEARRRVIEQIAMPWWYWWGLAVCWVGLGVASDLASAWVSVGATVAVGAGHAAVSERLLGGRQRSDHVRVSARVAGRRAPVAVVAFLLALVAATVAAGFAADADGARHPATLASVLVAVALVVGGPRLMAAIRADARRRPSAR